ncbi:hypothetical protein Tco_1061246, partial [Tanacetum coccineum]
NAAKNDDTKCWLSNCRTTRRKDGWTDWYRKWKTRGRTGDMGNGGIDEQGGQAQVGNQGYNQGNDRNQNGNAVNDNIQGDVRNVIMNNGRRGCSYKVIIGCGDDQKVKYTAGLFVGNALTWWNSQIHTRGRETAVGMAWEDFKTLMREELF